MYNSNFIVYGKYRGIKGNYWHYDFIKTIKVVVDCRNNITKKTGGYYRATNINFLEQVF